LIGGDPRRRWSDIMIGIGFVAIYTLYVVRVGGGFMYARLLIPTVPLLLVVFEAGLEPRPAWLRSILGVVVLGVPWLVEPPLWGTMIVDERGFYTKPEHASAWDRRSRIMRHYLRDTDVRVAFLGTWARAMRDTQIDPAIEAATGLTDATIAHQPLARRGQPGHEKAADPFYLADERRVHLVTGLESYDELGLERVVPRIELSLPDPMVGSEEEVVLFVVRWDPTLMSKLEARGAVMPDLPAIIEDLGRAVPRMRPEQCRLVHTQLRRLYFDQAPAPALAAPFEAACPLPAADPTSAHRSVP